jgi:hypothetical protein
MWWRVLTTALWAAMDSSRLQIKKFKSGMAYGPVVVFLGVLGVWIFAFPWYLAVRYRLKRGLLELKRVAES